MERLPRDTEMFVPNFAFVVVLNQNCGLQAPTRFFFWGIFFSGNDENTPPLITILLPLIRARNLGLCWNRFLRRTQTNRIKTVIIGRKTLIQASFESPATLFKLITDSLASALCSNYVNEFNLTRENTYVF